MKSVNMEQAPLSIEILEQIFARGQKDAYLLHSYVEAVYRWLDGIRPEEHRFLVEGTYRTSIRTCSEIYRFRI